MTQKLLSFESENLVVDYILFKFQDLDNAQQNEIATYLFKMGFNSSTMSGQTAEPIVHSIFYSPKNKFEVFFRRKEKTYWDGTTLHFTGKNGGFFYSLIQRKLVDWTIFSSGILGRFDLHYSRTFKREDKFSEKEFLLACMDYLKNRNVNVEFKINSKGPILSVGNRRSNNFYRIYSKTKPNSLRFEYEVKGRLIRPYHTLLVEHRLEEFERELSSLYLRHSAKILPLHFSYLDWLVVKLRPIRKQKFGPLGIKTHYIRTMDFQSTSHREKFFTLLRFLVYAQSLDYEKDSLGSTVYRRVIFRIKDFLKYTEVSDNHYQLTKYRNFFDELQQNSLIKFFSDTKYRSLVTIPEVNIEKRAHAWTAEVWIAEELFWYTHPFLFPDFFKRKITKDEFEVQFKVIQVFCSTNIEKTFDIKNFLKNYPSEVSNQQKAKIKEYFINTMKIFETQDLIDPNFKLIINGKIYDTEKLTSANISEGFVVYEKLSI